MATATPLDVVLPDAKALWFAQKIAALTPEERAAYDTSEVVRAIAHRLWEREMAEPGYVERIRGMRAALQAAYDGDAEREIADVDAGRHPLQRPR